MRPAAAPLTDATAWLAPYGVTYAQRPFEAAVADVPDGAYAYPPLFRTAPGTYALVTEADADGRYGGPRLRGFSRIEDLAAGTDIRVRVRSVRGDATSAWSEWTEVSTG
ncbi:hypothetical protein [Streptomyces sp. CMB-StM0423]|uniref:hypothetical protein n=1 Tax=Streptomyces sp. CMB-StM0423 TaxID=2059884 RepID=UPI001F1DD5DC|nr:hypothetical protein [Streptomyces sp. CMB-StM0423]